MKRPDRIGAFFFSPGCESPTLLFPGSVLDTLFRVEARRPAHTPPPPPPGLHAQVLYGAAASEERHVPKPGSPLRKGRRFSRGRSGPRKNRPRWARIRAIPENSTFCSFSLQGRSRLWQVHPASDREAEIPRAKRPHGSSIGPVVLSCVKRCPFFRAAAELGVPRLAFLRAQTSGSARSRPSSPNPSRAALHSTPRRQTPHFDTARSDSKAIGNKRRKATQFSDNSSGRACTSGGIASREATDLID